MVVRLDSSGKAAWRPPLAPGLSSSGRALSSSRARRAATKSGRSPTSAGARTGGQPSKRRGAYSAELPAPDASCCLPPPARRPSQRLPRLKGGPRTPREAASRARLARSGQAATLPYSLFLKRVRPEILADYRKGMAEFLQLCAGRRLGSSSQTARGATRPWRSS